MIVEGKTCYAYFSGKDGLGTCDTKCQWYREGCDCPMWIPKQCPWSKCAHGMGVAAYGACYVGGDPQNSLCQKFVSDEEWEKEHEAQPQ